MAVTVAEMLKMSQAQLDDFFSQSPAGEIPNGEAICNVNLLIL